MEEKRAGARERKVGGRGVFGKVEAGSVARFGCEAAGERWTDGGGGGGSAEEGRVTSSVAREGEGGGWKGRGLEGERERERERSAGRRQGGRG